MKSSTFEPGLSKLNAMGKRQTIRVDELGKAFLAHHDNAHVSRDHVAGSGVAKIISQVRTDFLNSSAYLDD